MLGTFLISVSGSIDLFLTEVVSPELIATNISIENSKNANIIGTIMDLIDISEVFTQNITYNTESTFALIFITKSNKLMFKNMVGNNNQGAMLYTFDVLSQFVSNCTFNNATISKNEDGGLQSLITLSRKNYAASFGFDPTKETITVVDNLNVNVIFFLM